MHFFQVIRLSAEIQVANFALSKKIISQVFLIFFTCEKANVKHSLCLRNFGSLKYAVRFEIHTNCGINHKKGR